MTKMTYAKALEVAIATVEDVEVVEKLEALKASLAKKSAKSGERKPTKTQIENEGIKSDILAVLGNGDPMTVGEITKALGDKVSSPQKTSALVRQLKESGAVTRTVVKGKALFTIAE